MCDIIKIFTSRVINNGHSSQRTLTKGVDMHNWFSKLVVLVIIIGALSPATVRPAEAQTPPPPREPIRNEFCQPGEPCEDERGERFVIPTEETQAEITAIGDSDDFGYTLTDIIYSWKEASSGTNAGLDGTYDITEAITLPFNFPFYENTYSQLYITGSGYMTFTDQWPEYYFEIPDESSPNNLISPLTKYQYYSGSAVYYKSFGTYFVVQWNHLLDYEGGVYTFEAVLYPDGKIEFHYKTLPDTTQGWYCSRSGIENSTGMDGLAYWNSCIRPPNSSTAVRFTKPGTSARVGANPLYLGEFSNSQDVDEFIFTITNTGDLGADTYDMEVTTAPLGLGWTASLHDPATGTLLGDTDGDSKADSGPLAQGTSREILVRVNAPGGLSLGAYNKTYVEVTSSLNTAKTKTVTIDSTVPAPFAQTYVDDTQYTLKSNLNWPSTQLEVEIAQETWNVYEPSIIETPNNNFVHVWRDHEWGEIANGWILRYAIINKYGEIIKPVTNLSAVYAVANYYTSDSNPTLAVAPDGKIGVIWSRGLDNPDDLYNDNIWFAVLNPNGSLALGPVNLTNNIVWGNYQLANRVDLYEPDISASADNRFMLSWDKYTQASDTEDIFYSIRQSNGAAVVPVTAMTASVSGASWYYRPVQISLSGNRFLVTYINQYINGQYWNQDGFYRVFDSSGNTLTPPSDLDYYPDTGIQLSGGNILLARQYNEGIQYQIRNSNFGILSTSGEVSHPSGDAGYRMISVTKDALNRGIITWSDDNGRYLYYAYVHGNNGALLSGPVISHRSADGYRLSSNGSSTTTNSWTPSSGVDLAASFSANLFGSGPGGLASLGIHYINQALDMASNPQLVLTLPAGLTYASDTLGITPSVVGNTVTWQLPDLALGDSANFMLYLQVDSGVLVPTFLDVSLAISSAGSDANPADNTDGAQVLVGLQVFLPVIMR